MSGNNNNENLHWKHKLEELESLPGESFDANASWGKLQARQKEAPRKNKAAWYWLAAACLVMVISFPWFFTKEKQADLVSIPTVPAKINLNDSNHFFVHKSPVTEKPALKTPVVINIPAKHEFLKPIRDTTTEAVTIPENMHPEMVIIQPLTTDTLKLIAAAPVKKKLKLVHFNELEHSADNTITGEGVGKPFFPVKFRTKEIYTNNAETNGNGRDHLIRIKLSSQN